MLRDQLYKNGYRKILIDFLFDAVLPVIAYRMCQNNTWSFSYATLTETAAYYSELLKRESAYGEAYRLIQAQPELISVFFREVLLDNAIVYASAADEYSFIPFSANMKRWLDFQRPFPRMMHMARTRRQLALKDAAQYFDIAVDRRKAHSALYDAEITAQLLMYFLDGTYRLQTQFQVREESTRMTGAIGDLCGGVLAELLRQMQAEAI